jgi:hypothetical protein
MSVDIAVPRTCSYRRVRGPLEVNLTSTGTHFRSWVTCTSSTVRHGAMAVKPKESTRNATLDSCHTVPRSPSIDRRLRMYGSLETNKRTAGRARTVWTQNLEETMLDTIEEKPSSSTRTTARDLIPLTLTFCCISYRAVTHKGSVSGHMFIWTFLLFLLCRTPHSILSV